MTFIHLGLSALQTGPAGTTSDTANPFGWVLGCVLAAGVIAVIVRPLLLTETNPRRPNPGRSQLPQRARLEGLQENAEAEQRSIADLDFDHEMGIIEERDYSELKERSTRKLAVLTTQINLLERNLNGSVGRAGPVVVPVVARSARSTKATPSASDKLHVKSAIREKMKCGECGTPFKPGERFCHNCQAPLPIFCLHCGNEVTEDDRFCAKCGSAVNT